MDFWSAIILHVIAAIPPTLAAMAALVTALRTKRDTRKIIVAVNGDREEMKRELRELREKLAQHRIHDGA